MGISGRLLRFAAIPLLTVSFALPAAAERKSTTAPSATAASASSIRIDNFGRVSSAYYRGAQPMGRDYGDLAALGIKTVINLTSDDAQADERALVEQAGMTYLQIPMTTSKTPTDKELAQFLAVVNASASQPVYVHCVGGKHRTGVMTAIYRMTSEGWTADRAFKEMKQYKFGADFLHPEFKKFVYAFHADPRPATPANTVVATTLVN